MRKLMLVVLILLTNSWGASGRTTGSRYAIAYGYKHGIRLAIKEGDEWRFEFLPNALYGQGDILIVAPVWSPNGATLYYAAAPSDTPDEYRHIYGYSIDTKKSTPVVLLPKAKNRVDHATISRSPSGRYLWLMHTDNNSNQLIDIQAPDGQRIRYQNSDCASQVVGWTESAVFVLDIFCPAKLKVIDLTTGEVLAARALESYEIDATETGYAIQGKTPTLLIESVGIARITADGKVEQILEAIGLAVRSDGRQAFYVEGNLLKRVDPETSETKTLTTVSRIVGAFSVEFSSIVNYWDEKDETLRLLSLSDNDQLNISVIPKQSAEYEFDVSGYVVIFHKKELDGTVKDITVDMRTGASFSTPKPGFRYLKASPDGAFLLFSCAGVGAARNQLCGEKDQLIVFDTSNNSSTLLSDGEPLPERNFHFERSMYYTWSLIPAN